ncbi:MAG: ComF family protein [Candidatus Niyogibacteria bacterium]|nr:ComF family protein [Candidatus Niyogibacteria bacterium]
MFKLSTPWNAFLDLIFPKKCFSCGQNGEFLCGHCLNSLNLPEIRCFACQKGDGAGFCSQCASFFNLENLSVFWATDYKNLAIKKMIKTFKYRRAGVLTETLGEILSQRAKKFLIQNTSGASLSLIIPVPLSPKRHRERGFNQAALIGQYLGQKNNLAFDPAVLLKIKNTSPQVKTAGRDERLKNLKESFVVSDSQKILGKTVILIDDVLTTGATIMECARILQKAGAEKIIALVVAH